LIYNFCRREKWKEFVSHQSQGRSQKLEEIMGKIERFEYIEAWQKRYEKSGLV